jgi:pyruvate/2-oxoglutarate dehydrogenase complex dihydrolipoamide acyltransferase (E2) component
MEPIEVKVPYLSEAISKVSLAGWKKRSGDTVKGNEVLAEIKTDRDVLEIFAPVAGVLVELLRHVGEEVRPGDVIATIDPDLSGSSAAQEPRPISSDQQAYLINPIRMDDAAADANLVVPSDPKDGKTLVVEIDGYWSASEFRSFFRATENLYVLSSIMQIERTALRESDARGQLLLHTYDSAADRRDLLLPEERLRVTRCQYASKGAIDFAGIGSALSQIKEFILELLRWHAEAADRELARAAKAEELRHAGKMNSLEEAKQDSEAPLKEEMLRQKVVSARLRNLRDAADIYADLIDNGHPIANARQIVAGAAPEFEALRMLVSDRKIVSACTTTNDEAIPSSTNK